MARRSKAKRARAAHAAPRAAAATSTGGLARVWRWLERLEHLAIGWLDRHVPVLTAAVRLAIAIDLADRAAALALFTMLAAVPALLGAMAVAGTVIARLGGVAERIGVGDATTGAAAMQRIVALVHDNLPGVTWDPTALATALVEHRTANGVVGVVGALVVGANLVARLDATVRLVLGRPRRSAFRAAGAMTLALLGVALLALAASFLGPLVEWGVRVVAGGFSWLSMGRIDSVALVVALWQIVPISIGFFALVRWSAGKPAPSLRRLAAVALVFGLLWFCGQRLFSYYVSEIIKMDAIYGALTGIVALLLWLYYAALAFLFAVAALAANEAHRGAARARTAVAPMPP